MKKLLAAAAFAVLLPAAALAAEFEGYVPEIDDVAWLSVAAPGATSGVLTVDGEPFDVTIDGVRQVGDDVVADLSGVDFPDEWEDDQISFATSGKTAKKFASFMRKKR